MAKSKYCFVNLVVNCVSPVEATYVSGSTANLGAWNASRAILTKSSSPNSFTLRKRFEVGETVEYKVLRGKDWHCVEKGMFLEEIPNHVFTAERGLTVDVVVYNWRID